MKSGNAEHVLLSFDLKVKLLLCMHFQPITETCPQFSTYRFAKEKYLGHQMGFCLQFLVSDFRNYHFFFFNELL